jgi:enoyl-CoA hydratase
MHLLLACDLAVAADDAFFGEPEIRFGGVTSYPMLALVVGLRRANQIWLTGERLDASRAEQLGLVNQVVAVSELDTAVARLVDQLVLVPGGGLRRAKAVSHRLAEKMGARDALDIGRQAAVEALSSKSAEAVEFDDLVRDKGLDAALAWLKSRFEPGSSGVGQGQASNLQPGTPR